MKGNILIAYYSRTGNTRKIAELIRDEVGGKIFQIQPKTQYHIDYDKFVAQAKMEIQTGYKPALKSKIDNIRVHDIIFIGSPNWWSTIAPTVATFLSEHNLAEKTVTPFCTHCSGGQAQVLKGIAKLCPDSVVLPGFSIFGDVRIDASAEVLSWLGKIRILR
jgi:flavodoxin